MNSRCCGTATPRPQLVVIAISKTREKLIKLRQSQAKCLLHRRLGHQTINISEIVMLNNEDHREFSISILTAIFQVEPG